MFNDEEFMDTWEPRWVWFYLADCGRWHRFEVEPGNPICSSSLEGFYLNNPKAVFDISSGGLNSRIDLSAMLQTDLNTGKQRRIQRGQNLTEINCSCFVRAPVFWEQVDSSLPYQLILLNDVAAEYQTVANYVKQDGLLGGAIVSISRIQNLDLWEIYCRKKAQLLRIKRTAEIQERRLFHGTDVENVDGICKYNFDLRVAGKNGRVYGKGIYFALHASFADKYSGTSSRPLDGQAAPIQGRKIIILARVMVGTSNKGESSFRKPDVGNFHDSSVDDVRHPKIFVIFDSNQVYPEYLIQYK